LSVLLRGFNVSATEIGRNGGHSVSITVFLLFPSQKHCCQTRGWHGVRPLLVAVSWWLLASLVCVAAVSVFLYQLRRREPTGRRPRVVVVPDQPAPAEEPPADELREQVDLGGSIPVPAGSPRLQGQLLRIHGTYRLECPTCELALEIRLPAPVADAVIRQTDEFVVNHTHGLEKPRVSIRLD
jgi:hypothetical protein